MEKQQLKQTKYDSLVTNRTMQLVKAVIPYINNDAGTLIGMLIKFQELQNAARINNNVAIAAMNADKHKGMESMLDDIKDFLDDDNREMLENISYPKAPLHDGAVVIRDGRIHSAACILPLTKNTNISLALGTRHRAAIGMSENSDATVVVVSEETGTISVASKGNLKRDFDAITLKTELENSISGVESADAGKKSKNPFKRMGWFK